MNKMTCGRESSERDFSSILEVCFHHKVKVLICSAGGDGSSSHVEEMLAIIEGIVEEMEHAFKIVTIETDVLKDLNKQRVVDGKSSLCGPHDLLKSEDVENAVEIVGQMGAEPWVNHAVDSHDCG